MIFRESENVCDGKASPVHIADMHTHSENSHDSVCKIECMYNAQKNAGTDIFAVTDHFDTDSFEEYDVFSPIKKTARTVDELRQKYKTDGILTGIEISEGFWHPSVCERAMKLTAYDVVIGSVHLVKYNDMTEAYSKIDFSALSKGTLYEYVDAYFDDVLTMLLTMDFDILAHLTCPLRYINGKYKLGVSLSHFADKIKIILEEAIKRGISLELNTSSYDVLNDFMPSYEILKQYYDMGGRRVTLGSDAHIEKNASKNFEEAIEAVKNAGFENIYYYRKRKPYQIKI